MRARNTPFLFRIEHVAFRAVVRSVLAHDHASARRLGRRLGRVGSLVLRRYRGIALDNLCHHLPDLDAGERRRVARQSFESLGMAVCEVVSAARMSAQDFDHRFTVEGEDILAGVDAGATGVLFVGCHLGSWQIGSAWLGRRYGGIDLVARPPENPRIAAEVLPMWQRWGNRIVDRKRASRSIYTKVRDGGRVGLLIDNRSRRKEGAIEVPFLGATALTSPIPAFVAIRTGAPSVPVACTALDDDRYLVRIESAIDPRGHSVESLTGRYLAWAESEVTRNPGAWMWMHRRWRTDT